MELRIIDLFIDDEIVIRIHHTANDVPGYEEMKIKVEDDGKYIETITIKSKKNKEL